MQPATTPIQATPASAEPERLDPRVDEVNLRSDASAESVLDASVWNEGEAVRAAANQELGAQLIGASVERLRAMAAIATLIFGAYFVGLALLVPHLGEPWPSLWNTLSKLLIALFVWSAAMYGVTKLKGVRPQNVHDLGYVYLFILCLLLGLWRHSHAWPSGEFVRQVSPLVLPILAFGALIPAAPRKALASCLTAAAMDPLALYVMRNRIGLPSAFEVGFLFATPLLAALVAYQISRVVHRLSEGIARAREVGSYRLVERLGVGGMAEVWRANHRMLARPAAVKLIRPQILVAHGPRDAERLLRLFAREARTTASLSSPHTIQVYDFGTTREGAFYYVMELLHGIDLQTLVERMGPQPSERVAYLLDQACHSLEEAHARNFVHRDVKPANIFTCHYGRDHDFVKVLDFGLVLDRHPTPEELEDERRFIGTPAVMAPEMVRFQAPVDARADIYALGCVGYWLLTGKRVFEAQTRHDMLVMHAHQKPVPPSKRIEAKVQPELEALIMACLEKNPNRRPQTARELRERLGSLTFEHDWSEERAALWWKRHNLDPLVDESARS